MSLHRLSLALALIACVLGLSLIPAVFVTATGSEATLTGRVIDTGSGAPIAGAVIQVGGQSVATSGTDGRFRALVPLDAPIVLASLTVDAAGYGAWTLRNTSLEAGVTRYLGDIALSGAAQTIEGAGLPAALTRTADDAAAAASLGTPSQQDYYAPRGMIQPSVSHFIVPETIRVGITGFAHCRDWLDAGQPIRNIVEMDFREYVKNVLPNEWPAIWPDDSLRAGAVAAKMFAWWRMTLNNPRPQGVHVVDNTCDQVFRMNSRRDTTDAAVDATWGYRMTLNERVTEIHYLARDEMCAERGWPNCMGQWGSHDRAMEGMNWQEILAYYFPGFVINLMNPIPREQNVILNWNFSAGLESWNPWGDFGGLDIADGVLRFFRAAGAPNGAVLIQDLPYQVPEGAPMLVSLQLGNSSPVTKSVDVHLRSPDSWDSVLSCQFTLLPGAPLLTYQMTGDTSTDWRAIRLEIGSSSPDGQPFHLLDNVSVHYLPSMPTNGGACTYPRPKRPNFAVPVTDGLYPTSFTLSLTPGRGNFRPGYNPSYHLQVSQTPDYATTVYDNGANLSASPHFPLTLAPGTYFARARQYDGVEQFSGWRRVQFRVAHFPGKAVLQAPGDAVDGRDLTFTWHESEYTTRYRLVLQIAGGPRVLRAEFSEAEICASGTCSLSNRALGARLLDGVQHRWWVVSLNPDAKARSARRFFTPDMPGRPLLSAPINGGTATLSDSLQWLAAPQADSYRLRIFGPDGLTVLRQRFRPDSCDSTICTVPLNAFSGVLQPGTTYSWDVRAKRIDPLAGSRSSRSSFTLLP